MIEISFSDHSGVLIGSAQLSSFCLDCLFIFYMFMLLSKVQIRYKPSWQPFQGRTNGHLPAYHILFITCMTCVQRIHEKAMNDLQKQCPKEQVINVLKYIVHIQLLHSYSRKSHSNLPEKKIFVIKRMAVDMAKQEFSD